MLDKPQVNPENLDKPGEADTEGHSHKAIVDAAIVAGVEVPKEVVIEEKKAASIRQDVAQVSQLDEGAKTSLGQRRVNFLWEITQTFIAITVTTCAMAVSSYLATSKDMTDDGRAAFQLISSAAFLVIGFYFGRTNHQRTGGVGANDLGR